MCGRTACTLAPDDIVRACSYHDGNGKRKQPQWKDAPGGQKYWTSYNIAPSSHTPVLVSSNLGGSKMEAETERVVIPMKWGLTPSWHKGDPYKIPYETNNCRAEGMLEKRTYKVPLQKGLRCIVLADGYFEWKATEQGKQPYFFYFPQTNGISFPAETVKTEEDGVQSDVRESKASAETHLDRAIKQEILSQDVKQEPSEDVKQESGSTCQHDIKVKSEVPADLKCKNEYLSTLTTSSSDKPGESKNNGHVKSFWDTLSSDSAENIPLKQISKEQTLQFSESVDVKESLNSPIKTKCTMDGNDTDDEVAEWKGQRLLTMAGVYDVWNNPDDSTPLYSYSIITVSASPDLSWCHHRMPAILSTEDEVRDWLDSANIPLQKASSLIKPYKGLKYHPVSKAVNSSHFKSPDCIKPVELGKRKESPSSNMMMNWLKSGSPVKKSKAE